MMLFKPFFSSSSTTTTTSSKLKFTTTRHHYTDTGRFEQSLDIYHPTATASISTFLPSTSPKATTRRTSDNNNNKILFVLVVGSAWLGHYWWIYKVTSWWNASGPRTVVQATQTTTCCIRHRGRFCIGKGPALHVCVAMLWSSLLWLMVVGSPRTWSDDDVDAFVRLPKELLLLHSLWVAIVCVFGLYATYSLYFHPVPTLTDMTHDVATALDWIHLRYPDHRIVFGGYSSGGHVAACTLAAWNNNNSSPPSWNTAIDAILYLSPVLGVPATTTTSTNTPPYSVLFVRTLLYLIWGSDWRTQVPSPLDDDDTACSDVRPHWIVACQSEVPFYGCCTCLQHLLDPLLCGAAYHAQRIARQQPRSSSSSSSSSTYRVLYTTNHWTMLTSPELRQAIQDSWQEIRSSIEQGRLTTTTKKTHNGRVLTK